MAAPQLGQIEQFIQRLSDNGETSYDFETLFAGPYGKWAKSFYYSHRLAGTAAVSPLILIETFFPSGRKLFWKPQRFPIADAHYAMGFAYLHLATGEERYYSQAVHFLEVLKATRAPGYERYCWGYPYDWVTRDGTVPANTPLITTVPYVYEAFESVYRIDGSQEWLEIMHSIAEHAARDIADFPVSDGCSSCGYLPGSPKGGVVNASAYRAALLMAAGVQFSDPGYKATAAANLGFVLGAQREDGSWYYSVDGSRDFIDHFHTCFVLKAVAKIEKLTGRPDCRESLDRGIRYYVTELFDEEGLPRPFSKAPRMAIYKRELYDYAECLNLGALLKGRYPGLEDRVRSTLQHVGSSWVKRDGSFRTRKLFLGWDNVPMHRWGQSQMFRALCLTFLGQQQGVH